MDDTDQEMRMFAAKGVADAAMKQAQCQVIEDMEDMRKTVKRLTDNTTMKKLLDKLSGVAKKGVSRMEKHMTNEKAQIVLQEAAQHLDAQLHHEMGRFLDGSASAPPSVSVQSIAGSIIGTMNIPKDIAMDIGETSCEFVTEIASHIMSATRDNWKQIKIWWYLQEKYEESMNMGLATYDSKVASSRCQIPQVTSETREELKKIIGYIHNDYSKCYAGMGMRLFGNSMILTCVYTAGISVSIAAAGGLSAVASSVMGESAVGLLGEVMPVLTGAAPVACYVAIGAITLAMVIGGIMWYFGTDNRAQLDKDLERWTRLIAKKD